ncbi:MAG: hypothetical protein HKN87_16130 [Saprospiraceae bacterium]|nr:hypothetical protein [Saprospiraceae bacterium]
MRLSKYILQLILLALLGAGQVFSQIKPSNLQFVRQGVKRLIFADDQSISLAELRPQDVIGMKTMYPAKVLGGAPKISVVDDILRLESQEPSEASIWFGGFNPFATYFIQFDSLNVHGELGFEFSDPISSEYFRVTIVADGCQLQDVFLYVKRPSGDLLKRSILTHLPTDSIPSGRIILQMLGSGLNVFIQDKGLPKSFGQADFAEEMDLRLLEYMQQFQSRVYAKIDRGSVHIEHVESALTTGIGQADIRAITYKNGSPFLDQDRIWYTMSIRGRALPHHLQGVFSMNPSVFDIRLEGIIVFDRGDGMLRNEISSHIFYDQENEIWRGLTTGFSAYAKQGEEKQILAIESQKDPRFGFSIMKARATGIVGDIEDSHIIYDTLAQKWRLLTCENLGGYKAVIMESDIWDRGYSRIAGPVAENSTGTSMQMIDGQRFCFAGSSAREIFIYSYPDLQKLGKLNMDLPPWDPTSRTRVWPNVVSLPKGFPFRFAALMMDRYNFPGQVGPHWSYGALHLYHGY